MCPHAIEWRFVYLHKSQNVRTWRMFEYISQELLWEFLSEVRHRGKSGRRNAGRLIDVGIDKRQMIGASRNVMRAQK